MLTRFTDRARTATAWAQDEAEKLGDQHVDTNHLLLGLIREREECQGGDEAAPAEPKPSGEWNHLATDVLETMGISLARLRWSVEHLAGASRTARPGARPLTSRARQALRFSLAEALSLESREIGTGHLLLGLARAGGLTYDLLRAQGGEIHPLRNRIVEAQRNPVHRHAAEIPSLVPPISGGAASIAPLPTAIPTRTRVFISYSHRDKIWFDRLIVHLHPLVQSGVLEIWSDAMIDVGVRWRTEIAAELDRARVAILMVTADYLASEFIQNEELPPLLAAASRGGCQILPVIVRPSLFQYMPEIACFQTVNSPDLPLSALSEHEQELVFHQVALALIDLTFDEH